jgi:hypothetical protein
VGGLTCHWQRHSVKPSWWECSTIVEQAETHLRVVVPTEGEEDTIQLVHVLVCWSCLQLPYVISHSEKKWAQKLSLICVGVHVQCPLLLSDFNRTSIFTVGFWNILKYQFACKSAQCSGSRILLCGLISMTKLIVAVRLCANIHKTNEEPG